jgi:2-oxo-4-hydroxy-4-carboxy-5-ureidoimidazoline decarboxylase
MITLEQVNFAPADRFDEVMGNVLCGYAPGVAQRAREVRPFTTFDALYRAMVYSLGSASREEQLALIQMQPAMLANTANATPSPVADRDWALRLGFATMRDEEVQRFAELDRRYREQFGFPCVVALQRHLVRDTVRVEIERRLANDIETEIMYAMQQMGHIVHGRLERLLRQV